MLKRTPHAALTSIGVPVASWRNSIDPPTLYTGRKADAIAGRWTDVILGAKKQVVAQYGEDSNKIQAMGLTKKSEISRPGRRAKPEPPK